MYIFNSNNSVSVQLIVLLIAIHWTAGHRGEEREVGCVGHTEEGGGGGEG